MTLGHRRHSNRFAATSGPTNAGGMCTHRSGSPRQLRQRLSCHWYLVRSCSFAASAASADAACARDLRLAVAVAHARSSSSRSFSASTGSTSPALNQPVVGAMKRPSRGTGSPSFSVTTRAPDVPLRATAQSAESRLLFVEALALAASNDSFASATDANARVSPVPSAASRTTESVRVDGLGLNASTVSGETAAPTPVSLCTTRSTPASAPSSTMSESTLPTTSLVRSGAAFVEHRSARTPPPDLKLQGNLPTAWSRVPSARSGASRRKWVTRRCSKSAAAASSAEFDDDTTSAARRSTLRRGTSESSARSLPEPSRSVAHRAPSSFNVRARDSASSLPPCSPKISEYLSWNRDDWDRATITVSSTRRRSAPTSKSATRRSVVIRLSAPPVALHSCSRTSASTYSSFASSPSRAIAATASNTAGNRMESAALRTPPRTLIVSLATTIARLNLTRAWGSDRTSSGSASSAASPTASTMTV
mmetsp:Transcript_2445/g.10510  ORF Transcript_2445/g.10510 Transcript_2445/m.10510 type:complete len:479 (-) Transcript_2445:114-1550(-)